MNTETMKAARYYGAKDLRVEETPIPSINKKQIKIEVKYCGICGSDLHEYCSGPIIIPINKPYPLTGHCGCTTMGHEFSGVVVQVGDDLNPDNIKIGDRVVVEPMFRNPDSFFTKRGEFNLSEPGGGLFTSWGSGLAAWCSKVDSTIADLPGTVCGMQTNFDQTGVSCGGYSPGRGSCPPGYAVNNWVVDFGNKFWSWCYKQ
ncbi:unnamed protein product [Adineta steineri]|uniref:Alcohol dehydrogenase-like N-terminal domain-containing protein n=1 Tax=Adineta steineri TaxID=433720 RepID=A0A814Q997_9BILA|nr:unnamed protein product [Adineta steineri]